MVVQHSPVCSKHSGKESPSLTLSQTTHGIQGNRFVSAMYTEFNITSSWTIFVLPMGISIHFLSCCHHSIEGHTFSRHGVPETVMGLQYASYVFAKFAELQHLTSSSPWSNGQMERIVKPYSLQHLWHGVVLVPQRCVWAGDPEYLCHKLTSN